MTRIVKQTGPFAWCDDNIGRIKAGALYLGVDGQYMRSGIGDDIYGIEAGHQALAVLRKYGSDAHMYMPGVGYVSGVDAGNYLDTAFAATAVDQPVGLVMDAANTARGPELVVNGDFSAGLTGWTARYSAILSVVSGRIRVECAAGQTQARASSTAFATVVGRSYVISASVQNVDCSGGCRLKVSNNPTLDSSFYDTATVAVGATVTSLGIFTATATTTYVGPAMDGMTPGQSGTFDNISVREVTGAIPASNNTTAQKPALKGTPILGPELVVNGDFSNGTTGWSPSNNSTLSVVGGELVVTGDGVAQFPGASQTVNVVSGRRYQISITGRRGTATGGACLALSNVSPGYNAIFNNTTANVILTTEQVATASTISIVPFTNVATTGTVIFDNISVREIVGYMAPYRWQLDGVDDRLHLAALPFQPTDDHFIVSAVRWATAGAARSIYSQRSNTNDVPLSQLYMLSTGAAAYQLRNDANASSTATSGVLTTGSEYVVTGRRSGANIHVRVDGAQSANQAAPTGVYSQNSAAIGAAPIATPGSFWDQRIALVVAGKGAITDADLLVLERFAAWLQGRVLP